MACFATPYGLRYAAHCFNRAYAQNNRQALIPAGGKLGVTSALQQFKGNSFPYTPKYQVILDSSYSWSVSESVDAFIGGNLNYRSATVAGFGSNTLLDIDSYALVDLRIGLESKNKRWRAQVFGKNIFDQYYWSNVAKFVDNVRRYSGSPATFGVSLSFRP